MGNYKHNYEIGAMYGILILDSLYRKNDCGRNRLYAKCHCIKCKKKKRMRATDLFNEKTISCSCQMEKHGMDGTRIYSIYHNMKYRCYNKSCNAYKSYGGKGVSICREWLEEFDKFYSWAINNGYSEDLTIDRIDEDGNYEPENCQWITKSENTAKANRRRVGMKYEIQ